MKRFCLAFTLVPLLAPLACQPSAGDSSSSGGRGADGGTGTSGTNTSGSGGSKAGSGGAVGSGGNSSDTGGSGGGSGSGGRGNIAGSGGSTGSGGASSGGSNGSGGERGTGGATPTGGRAGNGAAGAGGMGGRGGAGGGGNPGSGGAGPGSCPFSTAPFFLWTGKAPGSENVTFTETVEERSTNPNLQDRSLSHIAQPSMIPYLATTPNGAAAIVLPGGGYSHLAFDVEGVDIAKWLTSNGVSAFVVKYRLPSDFPGSPWIPLADAQRALRTIRSNAVACGIDPARIGVIGFSAGGHNASQLETRFAAKTTPIKDAIDMIDARPAFGILMYPVISMQSSITHAGSRNALLGSSPSQSDVTLYSSDRQVTAMTPPTFIGVSKKDTGVDPQNSVLFDNALKAAGVAEELHMYDDGAHGTGIRKATGDMAAWPEQAAAWLGKLKLTVPTN